MPNKSDYLTTPIQHLDITRHNVIPWVEPMEFAAFSARDLYRAASIYDLMLRDEDCGVILCLAGSSLVRG